jgi:hypothetical protein
MKMGNIYAISHAVKSSDFSVGLSFNIILTLVRANYTGVIAVYSLLYVQIFHIKILIKKYTSSVLLVKNIHNINAYCCKEGP